MTQPLSKRTGKDAGEKLKREIRNASGMGKKYRWEKTDKFGNPDEFLLRTSKALEIIDRFWLHLWLHQEQLHMQVQR